jgi:HeH/LEM domain
MESKLKALKVADLKDILSKANVSVPAKANKADLVAKISTSASAIDVYNRLYPSKTVPPPTPTNDDLVRVFFYLTLPTSNAHFTARSPRRVRAFSQNATRLLTHPLVSTGLQTKQRLLLNPSPK